MCRNNAIRNKQLALSVLAGKRLTGIPINQHTLSFVAVIVIMMIMMIIIIVIIAHILITSVIGFRVSGVYCFEMFCPDSSHLIQD